MAIDKRYAHVGGEICQNCNKRTKLCWKAPDDIWQKVTGYKEGILCIPCFDAIAEANGISLAWECKLHPVYNESTVDVDKDFLKVSVGCMEKMRLWNPERLSYNDYDYYCRLIKNKDHITIKCGLASCPKVNRARDVL